MNIDSPATTPSVTVPADYPISDRRTNDPAQPPHVTHTSRKMVGQPPIGGLNHVPTDIFSTRPPEATPQARQRPTDLYDFVEKNWNKLVEFREVRSPLDYAVPAVCKDRINGVFQVHIPNVGEFAVKDLAGAENKLNQHGIYTHKEQERQLAAAVRNQWGERLQVLHEKPRIAPDRPAIWLSKQGHGKLEGCTPEFGKFKADSLRDAEEILRQDGIYSHTEQARRTKLEEQVKARWGGQLEVLDRQPRKTYPAASIWQTANRDFGLHLPGRNPVFVPSLQEAERVLDTHNIHSAYSLADPGRPELPGTPYLSTKMRQQLEQKYGIQITPIAINGKQGAIMFNNKGIANPHLLVMCHGTAQGRGHFQKRDNLEFDFAAPINTQLLAYHDEFALKLKNNEVIFKKPSQIQPSKPGNTIDYLFKAAPDTITTESVAELVSDIYKNPGRRSFDIVILDPGADKISFSELLGGIDSRLGPDVHQKITCFFCRKESSSDPLFDADKDYSTSQLSPKRLLPYVRKHL